MFTIWEPPVADNGIVSGVTTAVQPLSCVTVNVWPVTLIVPLRAAPEFGAAANCTVPGPLPLDPAVTLIHAAFETAVHAHDKFVFTVNEPGLPPAGIDCEVGLSEMVQPFV
jgi:hypothetical protein